MHRVAPSSTDGGFCEACCATIHGCCARAVGRVCVEAHPREGVGIVRADGSGGRLNHGYELAHTSTGKGDTMSRLSLILSATALVVSLLGATPLGEAAGPVAAKVVPFAKRAGYATNAGAVNGIRAARTPAAGRLVPLDQNGKLPEAALPARAPAFAGLEYVYGLGDSEA